MLFLKDYSSSSNLFVFSISVVTLIGREESVGEWQDKNGADDRFRF